MGTSETYETRVVRVSDPDGAHDSMYYWRGWDVVRECEGAGFVVADVKPLSETCAFVVLRRAR
jgi:hypothetical protein